MIIIILAIIYILGILIYFGKFIYIKGSKNDNLDGFWVIIFWPFIAIFSLWRDIDEFF